MSLKEADKKADNEAEIGGDLFIIGTIVNTQGLGGEVRVLPSTDDPTRFAALDEAAIKLNGADLTYKIEKTRQRPPFVILKLEGVNDKTAADGLKGAVITVTRAQAVPCGDGEYYVADLIGCDVYEANGCEDGEFLGKLVKVASTGANDVYEVRNDEAGDFILIPAIKQCVISVDTAGKRIKVKLLPGLREANAPKARL